MLQNRMGWLVTARYCRARGYMGMGLIFAMPFGILGLLAAGLLGHWALGVGLLAWAVVNRLIMALAGGWWGFGAKPLFGKFWFYRRRDLLGLLVCCMIFTGPKMGGRAGGFNWRA